MRRPDVWGWPPGPLHVIVLRPGGARRPVRGAPMADVEIPASCSGRPTVGGVVAPFVNIRLADGGVDFHPASGHVRAVLAGEPVSDVRLSGRSVGGAVRRP